MSFINFYMQQANFLLYKQKVATAFSVVSENANYSDILLIFFSSFVSFSALRFDFLSAAILGIILSIIAFLNKKISAAVFLVLNLLSFSYQAGWLGWLYLIIVGGLALFEFFEHWRLFLVVHLIAFASFSLGPAGIFLSLFSLALASFYYGSKKSVFISLAALIFYFSILSIFPFHSYLIPYSFSSSSATSLVSDLKGSSILHFENFLISSLSKFIALENFFLVPSKLVAYFSKILSTLVFYIFYIGIWVITFFLMPFSYAFIQQNKKSFSFSNYAQALSSAWLILLFLSNLFYAKGLDQLIMILISCVLVIGAFVVLDSLGLSICKELELISLSKQKGFGKFGLRDLSKSELGPASLDDVGGYENLKQELLEAIALPLKHKDFSKAYGLKPSTGILLFGPPGTGKTLIVSALAKDLNIPFYYVKCSDILSSWYGESEKNVSELFELARKNAPAILFFDEIEALARSRSLSFNDEVSGRVLAVFLAELDGLKTNKSIPLIVIGATNLPSLLDPAILRPGRLDKLIFMPLPDKQARLEILKVHTKNIALDKDVNLEQIAELSEDFSGADLANLITEAKRLAIREAKLKNAIVPISQKHLLSLCKILKPSVSKEDIQMYKEFEEKFKRQVS